MELARHFFHQVLKKSNFLIGVLFLCLFRTAPAYAFLSAGATDYPVFVASLANPNDYQLFANGGWDGNWYVGSNTCWTQKLPPIPPGEYARAYLGVKLGRMKLQIAGKTAAEKMPISGRIEMAISSTSAWTTGQSVFITSTDQIPLEGDYEMAVEGSGESEWFWSEVPLDRVNRKGGNYIALWSPTLELLQVSSSPVLAAAFGGKDQNTWLSHDIHGTPPGDPHSPLGSSISYFKPAIALKLIPRGVNHPIQVNVKGWLNGTEDHPKPIVTVDAEGPSIEQVWLEYNADHSSASHPQWQRIGRPLWKAPYIFTVDQAQLPHGRVHLRAAATNIWEDLAASQPFTVEVSTVSATR